MDKRLTFFRDLLVVGLISNVLAAALTAAPCALKETQYGAVCVCNAEYCDYLDDPTPGSNYEFAVISSSKAGLRFEKTVGLFNLFKKFYILDYDQRLPKQSNFEPALPSNSERATNTRSVQLHIDRDKQHQKIVGFGSALTGSVSHLLQQLPQALQDHIYASFYSERGIGFNLMRLSIGGSDFDLAPWAYNEVPENDAALSNFTELHPRDLENLEQIKRLKKVSKVRNLCIMGAAWSPPPWMKSNNNWSGFSHLKEEYYQTWADYHLRWLELMEKNGIPVWAISTGNEPLNGLLFKNFVTYMSLGWTPKAQGIWLADHLGSAIRNSKYKDVLIFGNDGQRFTFPIWFHKMQEARVDAMDYLDGLATHWYSDEHFNPIFIDKTLAEMPEKLLINTASYIGEKPWKQGAPMLGSWERGEKYISAFVQDLQHGFNGWIDWNMMLDDEGGPNHVNNTVDAPIIVNTKNPTEVYKHPMFYAIGHFSKFLPEGSIRVDAVRTNDNVETVAFLRPDGSICIVAFNSGSTNVDVNVVDSMRGTIVVNIPPRSVHTIIYN